MARANASPRGTSVTFTGRAAVAMRRTITTVVYIICGLTFCFGFGNGYAVGVQLGVPGWIAPLVAPAVDLSVAGLLAALQFLRANGVEGRLLGPRALLAFCCLVTLGLNVAHPILVGAYGQAAFYAISPLILIGWSEVGPKLLASLHGTVRDEVAAFPGPSPVVLDDGPAQLVARARQLDAEHQEEHGRPISRDKLRAALKISNALAGEVLRRVRGHEGEV
jgi:hypothetical protein